MNGGEEFSRAKTLGLGRMEWTLDQARLRDNPLTTAAGRAEILRLALVQRRRDSEPDRRLFHAGAVLEDHWKGATGAAGRP